MESSKSKIDDIDVLRISGRINAKNVPEFENLLNQYLNSNTKAVVIDGKELEYINSAGFRVLLATVNKEQFKIAFANCNEQIIELIHGCRFDKIFPIYASREEAAKELQ